MTFNLRIAPHLFIVDEEKWKKKNIKYSGESKKKK